MSRISDHVVSFLTNYRATLIVAACGIGFSIWLQGYNTGSAMQFDEETWQGMLNLHLTWNPFAVRFFQSYSTLALHTLFGWPVRESFFAVQFTLEMILAIVMHRYLCRLGFDRTWAVVGVALTLLAYPIFGANFEPTHTWDDFWLYLFLALTLLAALNRRTVAATVYLTLALFAREQAVIFYPLVLLTLWWQEDGMRRLRILLPALLPLLVYGLYRFYRWEPIDPFRWKLVTANFETSGAAQDSLVSLIVSFGCLWLLALWGLGRTSEVSDLSARRLLRWGLATAVPLTTAVALLFTFVRETRILFPSFVIIVPLALLSLRAAWNRVRHLSRSRLIGLALLILIAAAAAAPLGRLLFPECSYGSNAWFRRKLVGIHLGLLFMGTVAVWTAGLRWFREMRDRRRT